MEITRIGPVGGQYLPDADWRVYCRKKCDLADGSTVVRVWEYQETDYGPAFYRLSDITADNITTFSEVQRLPPSALDSIRRLADSGELVDK